MILPHGVTQVGEGAFRNCSALEQVDLPKGLTALGPEAFSYSGLTEITIPDGVILLPKGVFSFCYSLQRANLAEGLTEIEAQAFENCSSLETLSIPRSVERIGAGAFRNSGIRQIDLPSGVRLGEEVFQGSSLEKLTFDGAPVSYLRFVRTYGQTLRNTPLINSITDSWYLEDSPGNWYNANSLTSKTGRLYARQVIAGGTVSNVRSAYDWMCENCSYTYDTGQHVSASDGPFFYGYTSCNGVALAMQAFLDELNIPSFLMTGMVTGTYGRVGHAWNKVSSGSGFSIVDATDTKKGDYSTYMVDNYNASEGYSSGGLYMKYEFNWDNLNAREAACLCAFSRRVSSDQPLTFTQQEASGMMVTSRGLLNGTDGTYTLYVYRCRGKGGGAGLSLPLPGTGLPPGGRGPPPAP